MPEASVVEWIRGKYVALVGELDERGRRRWAAIEAVSLGRGRIAAVAEATGISDRTVRNGIRELKTGTSVPVTRQRRPGAGRLAREEEQPGLMGALEGLVEPVSRGDPMSPLRWTCKSTRTLAAQLTRQKHPVSHMKVAQLLHEEGYSLQGNRKMEEGDDHPDRDAQFRHINAQVKRTLANGAPVISVDT